MGFLLMSILLCAVIIYMDKVIEWLCPKSDLADIDNITDDVILHIGSHEDMH